VNDTKVRKALGPSEFSVKVNFRLELFLDRTVHKQRNSKGEEEEFCQNRGLN
jgi:hypothetical protein